MTCTVLIALFLLFVFLNVLEDVHDCCCLDRVKGRCLPVSMTLKLHSRTGSAQPVSLTLVINNAYEALLTAIIDIKIENSNEA